MININELESRWMKYKVKSYIPHIFVLLISIIFVIFLFLFDFSSDKIVEPEIKKVVIKKQTNKIIEPSIEKEEIAIKRESKSEVKIKEFKSDEKITLSPSLDFMDKMSIDTVPYFKENEIIEEVYFENKPKKIVKPKIKSIEPIIDDAEVTDKKTVTITRRITKSDIEHVKKRFEKSNNPALSLFIAKKYYESGDYNQAYNYSLLTNEINNDIEASWTIFAKSLVKLGKKKQAILMLKKYIKHSHSSRAKILHDDIISGKMR